MKQTKTEEETTVLNLNGIEQDVDARFEQTRGMGLPLWKRILDLAVLALLFPAALFIGLSVALLIKCGSPGPIIFRQRRIGYKSGEFVCFKFRTMRVDADAGLHKWHTERLINEGAPMTKLDATNDSRLVPFGAALRAMGLDELPQLINVLRGEMSLVGPRPCIPYEYELYESWQCLRFEAVPGLTGLWQVSGKNRMTFNEMIRLDIEYSRRLSLWMDLAIMMKTLPAIWTQCVDMLEQRRRSESVAVNGSRTVRWPS